MNQSAYRAKASDHLVPERRSPAWSASHRLARAFVALSDRKIGVYGRPRSYEGLRQTLTDVAREVLTTALPATLAVQGETMDKKSPKKTEPKKAAPKKPTEEKKAPGKTKSKEKPTVE